MAQDVSRDLVVSLHSISAYYANGTVFSLLTAPIWTFIDSTLPYIYLPVEVCQAFERSLGLVWNTTYEMYFVDDDLHGRLMDSNLNIKLKLANTENDKAVVEISLPYASFDLVIGFPLMADSLRYFPLLRAADENQYTLGRTFLQEA